MNKGTDESIYGLSNDFINNKGTLYQDIRRTYKLDIFSFDGLKPYLSSKELEIGFIELHPKGISVGRSMTDISGMREGMICITHPSISSKHCFIRYHQDKILINDIGSTNGLYAYNQNRELIRSEAVMAGENEEFFIGHVSFYFCLRREKGNMVNMGRENIGTLACA